VKGHNRHIGNGIFGRTIWVKSHIRETGTQGAIRRHEDRRSKQSRAIDESRRAKKVGSIKHAHDRKRWTEHPGEMDIAGVDSDGHRKH
jgi:hypothetical protein